MSATSVPGTSPGKMYRVCSISPAAGMLAKADSPTPKFLPSVCQIDVSVGAQLTVRKDAARSLNVERDLDEQ
jgi:hypothetical protein